MEVGVRIARLLRKRSTRSEQILWRLLRNRRFEGYKFRRQHPEGPHILDFYCPEARLDIELDGHQHGQPLGRRVDACRDTWLQERGIRVLRFSNRDLLCKRQMVLENIWQTLQELAPRR
jgi:very-short-patch-repair endonuclease